MSVDQRPPHRSQNRHNNNNFQGKPRDNNRPQRPRRDEPPAFIVSPYIHFQLLPELAGRFGEWVLAQHPEDRQFAALAHQFVNASYSEDIEEEEPQG